MHILVWGPKNPKAKMGVLKIWKIAVWWLASQSALLFEAAELAQWVRLRLQPLSETLRESPMGVGRQVEASLLRLFFAQTTHYQ